MKSDHQLNQDVMAEFAWDPAIKADSVGVAVKDGIVTLSGRIDTYAEKRSIENALRRVSGVKAIALEPDVNLSALHKRNDTELAAANENALKWNSFVSTDGVRVTVDNGWVTLAGELDWDYRRQSVEKAVRPLIGVTGVNDQITLKPRVTPADVTQRIEQALKRRAGREAQRVQVAASGSAVTLRGSVHSWQERDAAAGAAWAAPGVHAVINELTVGA